MKVAYVSCIKTMLFRNKTFILCLVLAVVIVACLCIAKYLQISLADKLLLASPNIHDFGSVPSQQIFSYAFNLNNESNEDIRIENVSVSCGCVGVAIDKTVVNPHGTSKLIASLSTEDKSGKVGAKLIVSWYSIKSRRRGEISLFLKANAESIAIINPPILDYGMVDVKEGNLSLPIHIKKSNSTLKWNEIDVLNGNGDKPKVIFFKNTEAIVTTEFTPHGKLIGTYRDRLSLIFKDGSHDKGYAVEIPIVAKIVGPVRVVPSSLYIGALQTGATYSGSFRVSSQSHAEMQIINIQDRLPMVVHTTVKGLSRGLFDVLYAIKVPSISGEFSGELLLSVKILNQVYTVRIPYMGYAEA